MVDRVAITNKSTMLLPNLKQISSLGAKLLKWIPTYAHLCQHHQCSPNASLEVVPIQVQHSVII